MTDEKPLKVAVYCRVSTDDKGQDVSLQVERCRKYCEAMGWPSVEFIDHESAYRKRGDERPQFSAMMEAVRTHQVRGVIVYQMDRFSREDPMKVSSYLDQIVHDHGGIFVSIADGVDSRNDAFAIIERVMSWQANNWSRAHGQRVKDGIARERDKRRREGAGDRWGRRPVEIARGEPELIEKAGKLRAQGASWNVISRKLGVSRTTARRMCQKAHAPHDSVNGTVEAPATIGEPSNHSRDGPEDANKTSNRNGEDAP
jgi:DNA invertase Pin-like site-specific DNA recombinase